MNKILIILFGILTLPVWALDDTVTNREIQTDRYIAARPTKEVMDVLMDSYLKTDESSLFKQQEQKDLVHKYCDIDTITKEMKVSMVRIYTADELKALADFYESPAAK